MYEGPRLSHLLAKHIFLDPYLSKKLGRLMGFQDKHFLWYSDTSENLHGGYYNEEEMQLAKKFGHNFFKDKTKFNNWIDEQDRLHIEAKSLMDKVKLEKEIKSISKEELIQLIPLITKIRSELFVYVLSCQPQCTDGLSEELHRLVKGNKELFIKLTGPEKKSFFTHEELDWLDILINSREDNIEKHHEKYFLIPASDRTEPWSLDHFKKLFKDAMDSDIDFKEKKINLEKKYSLDKEEIIIKNNLSSKVKELGSKIAEIGYYRFLTSFYGRWLGYYLVLICRRFAPELGLSFEELSSCDEEELISLLSIGKGVEQKELASRALAQTIVIEDGEINIHFGRQAIKKKQGMLAEIDYSRLTEIKGEVANLGKVKGKAYVFYWNDDIGKKIHTMPKDCILVAPQTHPIYMPAIRKAKALVTDEGGVTGHAAIVSRELDKPCVIGLHIITKVIKTGDLIEVDANNGVVRIIERKS